MRPGDAPTAAEARVRPAPERRGRAGSLVFSVRSALGSSAPALVGHGSRASVSRKETERARCALWVPGRERPDRTVWWDCPPNTVFHKGR